MTITYLAQMNRYLRRRHADTRYRGVYLPETILHRCARRQLCRTICHACTTYEVPGGFPCLRKRVAEDSDCLCINAQTRGNLQVREHANQCCMYPYFRIVAVSTSIRQYRDWLEVQHPGLTYHSRIACSHHHGQEQLVKLRHVSPKYACEDILLMSVHHELVHR